MHEDSIRSLGLGRGIVVDKNGKAIGGNQTTEIAVDAGLEDAIFVHTDGTQLVVTVRDDLDLDSDPRARQLAYADNRVGQVSFDIDPAILTDDLAKGVDLSGLFDNDELAAVTGDYHPVDISEQGRLDEKSPIKCPHCGKEFTPK